MKIAVRVAVSVIVLALLLTLLPFDEIKEAVAGLIPLLRREKGTRGSRVEIDATAIAPVPRSSHGLVGDTVRVHVETAGHGRSVVSA